MRLREKTNEILVLEFEREETEEGWVGERVAMAGRQERELGKNSSRRTAGT